MEILDAPGSIGPSLLSIRTAGWALRARDGARGSQHESDGCNKSAKLKRSAASRGRWALPVAGIACRKALHLQ
jgi:hypothetical protein